MSKVIVVGAGNWGKNLIQNFYDLNALAGIVEIDPQLREKTAQSYPDISIYDNYQAALESSVQAIVLATPAPFHYAMTKQALEIGKDVFVEKPMTLHTSEAQELAVFAEENNRILMVGHLLLYQPAIIWMREYLASGKAGSVYHVETQRVKLGRVRREENVWWSFAPHDVSVILALLGNPKLKSIKTSGQAILQPAIEDNVYVDLVFETGQTGHLHSSWYWPELKRHTTVICEKSMLVYDELSSKVTVYNKAIDQNLNNVDQGSWSPQLDETPPLKLECQHFLDCLENRQKPRSDAWNGVNVVEILEKAMHSK
jgi:predicted dehydrogenase